MRALNRKLVRDLRHLRGQVIAVAAVVACGVAAFVAMRSVYHSLQATQSTYYRLYRFADIFAHLRRAPDHLKLKLEAIPGVATVVTRVVAEATIDLPWTDEPITGRFISVPEEHPPDLNQLYLRSGSYLTPGRHGDVIASEAFAQANGLVVGDTIAAILNGRLRRLRIVGLALSPEYVYEIRGVGDVFPDNRRFGVFWASPELLGPAFDLRDAFNDVALALSPGADEAEVISQVDRVLDRYGGLGAYGREDQLSNRFVSDEIAQSRVSSMIAPTIFLSVAAFLLHVLLVRLVALQRSEIAVLKAFGYTDTTVGLHYLGFAIVIIGIGALIGTALGLNIGSGLTRLYTRFYHFPVLTYEAGPRVILPAIGINLLAALLGAIGAVRRAVSLPPAEAMRPEPPARFRAGIVELFGLQRLFSPAGRIVIRNIERRPFRALFTALGISLAVAILVMGRYFLDMVQYMQVVQFQVVQREDLMVVFDVPLSNSARYELLRLPGVRQVEPFRIAAARLVHGHRSYRAPVIGQEPGGELRRLIGKDLVVVGLPPDGLILGARLAEHLEVEPGELLRVEILEGERPVRLVPVAGLVDEVVGAQAYMALGALNRLLQEDGTISGAFMTIDSTHQAELYATLEAMPGVSGISVRTAMRRSFQESLAESIRISTTVLIGFAIVIAVGIVYNGARISLSERGRELATLRVLGFQRREVAGILLGEQAILTILALPLGFLIGYLAAAILVNAAATELFKLPLIVSATTYAFAAGIVLAAAAVSALAVRRRLDRIDLIEVLKTRE
jgi:putative ABC transport system permease protein